MLDASIEFKAFSLLLFNSFHCVKGIVIVASAWFVEDVPDAKDRDEHNNTDNSITIVNTINCSFDFLIHIYPLYIASPLLCIIFSFHANYITTATSFIAFTDYPQIPTFASRVRAVWFVCIPAVHVVGCLCVG